MFIKRTGVFYFPDAELLRIQLLHRSSVPVHFALIIRISETSPLNPNIQHERGQIHQQDTRLIHGCSHLDFHFSLLDTHLDLVSRLRFKQAKKVQLQVKVYESNMNRSTKAFLDVQIENLKTDFESKKGSFLCTKCFYMTEKADYVPLKWWLTLNRLSGYDGIQFCDHRVEKTPKFERLFHDFKDFLSVTRLECIPNLNSNPVYSRIKYINYTLLVYEDTAVFDVVKMDVVNQLILNECYLQNMHKYKYISVFDIDELVITKQLPELATLAEVFNFTIKNSQDSHGISSLECKQEDLSQKGQVRFDSYLEQVKNMSKQLREPSSYFVNQAYYLEMSFMDHVFQELAQFLKNHTSKLDFESEYENENTHVFNVSHVNNRNGNVTFEMAISSQLELDYAKSLLVLYKQVVVPFVDKNRDAMEKYGQNYDRLFATIGYLNSFALGKTIHDTRVSFDMNMHFMETFVSQKNRTAGGRVELDKDLTNVKAYTYLESAHIHMSHFRHEQYFDYKRVNFRDVYFDFNYFNCYFRPVLQAFASQKSVKHTNNKVLVGRA